MACDSFAILADVQDCTRFRFHFVDVEIELSSDLVRVLRALDIFLLFCQLSLLHLLLRESQSVLDAQLVVTTLLLPELLEVLTLCYVEAEFLVLNVEWVTGQLLD